MEQIERLNGRLREEEDKLIEGAMAELIYIQRYITNSHVAVFFISIIDILSNARLPYNWALISVLFEQEHLKPADQITQGAALEEPTSSMDPANLRDAVHELNVLEELAFNPLVKMLFNGLINILTNPEVPSNAVLINFLLQNGFSILDLSNQETSDSLPTSLVQIKLPALVIPNPYDGKLYPNPPEEVYKFGQRITSSIISMVLNLGKRIRRLWWFDEYNIWHEQVEWHNDLHNVLIMLPIDDDITLDQIHCTLLHFEMGHQLDMTYPGAKFSTLINHSNINGVVEVRIVKSRLIIRLTKTSPVMWPYLTLVSVGAKSVFFHLSPDQRNLEVTKDFEVMKIIHETTLDPEPHSGLPHVKYLDLIERKFEMDPRPELERQLEDHKSEFNFDGHLYTVVFRCRCVSCENATLEPCDIPDQAAVLYLNFPTLVGPRTRDLNQQRELGIWDVWWMNDLDHIWIYLPLGSGSIRLSQIKCSLLEKETGFHLQVKYPGTIFEALINHKQIMKLAKVKIKPNCIIVRLAKRDDRLYPYISFFANQGESLTYHPNPHYQLTVPNDPINLGEALEEDFTGDQSPLPSIGHFRIIQRSHDLQVARILQDCRNFHACPPQPDTGYELMKLHRN